MFRDFYRGKRVLMTGHTGFKGSWLCEWLLLLGAEIAGYSLEPSTDPALFALLKLDGRIKRHSLADVRDPARLDAMFEGFDPDIVFHLAAQPLVRRSYAQPVETYQTNVMGTVNVLECVRRRGRPCTVVVVTTDKCYQNKEWVHSYREDDPLGGLDPYSSSKAGSELVIAAYRHSYFSGTENKVRVCSARAGNVIGGGDWAPDRIVPDSIRSLRAGVPVPVRNKISTRPWQHVLEPLSGYLHLGERLASSGPEDYAPLASAFNFGPDVSANRTVAALVEEILLHWPGSWSDRSEPGAVHEAKLLNLSTDKAHHLLNWQPVWAFPDTVKSTAEWYRAQAERSADPISLTQSQIREFAQAANAKKLGWSR